MRNLRASGPDRSVESAMGPGVGNNPVNPGFTSPKYPVPQEKAAGGRSLSSQLSISW